MKSQRMTRALTSWAAAVATLAATFVVTGIVAPGRADAAASVGMTSVYDNALYGDLIEFGNSALTCPSGNAVCAAGAGTYTASNNNFSMVYADVDGDSSTYDSSQARFTIPAGTKVAYARLNWGGMSSTDRCLGDATVRSGTAPTDPVKLNVGGSSPSGSAYTTVGSTYFNNDGLYYTAAADVTANFAGVAGGTSTTVTVANVFGPSGTGCAAGWGIEVVYQVISPTCATPMHHVFVYNGHQTVDSTVVTVSVNGFKVSTTPATVGVIAYEGDADTSGDTLTINGSNIPEPITGKTNNFFTSSANGASNPSFPSTYSVATNFSVDAKAFNPPASVIKTGDTSATLSLASTGDIYVLQGVALSVPEAGVCITKSVSPATAHAGDPVTWTINVSNPGTGALTSVNVSDALVPSCAKSVGTLAGGANTTYTCTSAAPAQSMTNTATASGINTGGDTVGGSATAPLTVINPGLKVTKSVDKPTVVAGTLVTYTITVQNTGDVPLTGVAVDDTINNACDKSVGSLAVGGSSSYTCTATISQDTTNTVNASGTDPIGKSVSAAASASVVVAHPAITVSKTVDRTQVRTGSTVTYTITVKNTGDIGLANVAVDDTINNACDKSVGTLNAGASSSYTCQAVISQDTVNTVNATGDGPAGSHVSATASATVKVMSPALRLTKSAGALQDTDGNGPDAGDTIPYSFTVTNSGDTALTQISVNDPQVASVNCPATTLAVGASVTCTGTHVVTQAEVDAGVVKNTATASAADPNGDPLTSAPASATTPLSPLSKLQLTKRAAPAVDANHDGMIDPGDTIAYSFTVTNVGATTLSGLAIQDDLRPVVTCSPTTLGPGQTATCTTPAYSITQADMDAGTVNNTATATATTARGESVTSNNSSTSTPLTVTGALTLVKQAGSSTDVNHDGLIDAGDTIPYTFKVTNSGNVTLSSVTVNDPKVTSVECPGTVLAPGASMTCTATYSVADADVAKGSVVNTATASGASPAVGTITSQPSTATVPTTAPRPALTLVKSAGTPNDLNHDGLTDAGDTVDYTFKVTNSGNVALSGVTVSDPKVTAVGCPATTLSVGASMTCTATYTITAADVSGGSVVNTASAGGSSPSGTSVTSPPSTATVPTTAPAPGMALKKTAGTPTDVNHDGLTDAGDTIAYTFTVANTGNVALSSVLVSDPKVSAVTCPATTLAVGASMTCTAPTYTITASDVSRGSVVNTATAGSTAPDGSAVSARPSSATVPTATPQPGLSFDKQAGAPTDVNKDGLTDAGDTIVYSFVVANVGNVPLSGVGVVDPKLGSVSCPSSTLAVGASMTCTAAYTITASDVSSGSVTNVAHAAATDPDGGAVASPNDGTSTPTTAPRPGVALVKSAGTPSDVNHDGLTDAGDTVVFTFRVTNTGNVTLTSVGVSDPKVGPVSCPSSTLAVGASMTCTAAAYAITTSDVSGGSAVNTATASGTTPAGGGVTSPPSTATVPTTKPRPALSFDKQAGAPTDVNKDGLTDAGDTIPYSFVVTNSGNVPLGAVAVTDPKVGPVTCPATTLAVGASVTCSATAYEITASDVSAGAVTNLAHASATDPDGGAVTSPDDGTSTPTTAPMPALSFDKQAGTPTDVNKDGLTDAGDTIAYSFVVANVGNVPLSGVGVVDPKLGSVNCPSSTLSVGASMTCTAAYTITASDVSSGSVTNVAHAAATDPDGGAVASPDDGTSTPTTAPQSGLSLVKAGGAPTDVNRDGLTDAGDTVAYTFKVTNTGNVTITGLTVDDAKVASVDCPSTTLPPGAAVTCTATYTITAGDVAHGSVVNAATAAGTRPDQQQVTSGPSTATVPTTAPKPALSFDKRAGTPVDVNKDGLTDAGDTIAYSFVVANVGNVPLSEVGVADPKVGPVTCPATSLAVGASMTCTAAYTITASDVSSGSVTNVAHAAATDPDGGAVVSPNDGTSTPTTEPAPALSLVKSAGAPTDVNHDGITDAGDTVVYTFKVTNTGNVTVTGLTVDDAKVASVNCPTQTIAPGDDVSCTASYLVTDEDVASGAVVNTATASGAAPGGATTTSPPSKATVPTTAPHPALTLVKSAGDPADLNHDGLVDAGDTIGYSFKVTNTGNVPVTSVAVADGKVGPVNCPQAGLTPGGSLTCTASYVITASDVGAGSVLNTATASGADPYGHAVTSPASTANTATTAPRPALSFDKRAGVPVDVNHDGLVDAGDTIAYAFTVTNTGNVPVSDVAVDDPKAGPVSCSVTALAVGQSTLCTTAAPYVITSADVESGSVVNVAHAAATDPDGATVRSGDAGTSTPTTQPRSALELIKTAGSPHDVNADGLTDEGDTVAYTFTVTNTGNVPVAGLVVSDPRLTRQGIGVSCASTTLAPAAHTTCVSSRDYVVTNDDVAGGALLNTATVSGSDPNGQSVQSPAAEAATRTARPAPALALVKTAGQPTDVNADGRTDAGDTVAYAFTVTNVGNVPVSAIAITDPMLGAVTCAATSLTPGATTSCTGPVHTITQAEVDAGDLVNHASVSGTSPDGVVTAPATAVATVPLTRHAALALDKRAGEPQDTNGDGVVDAGDTIGYTFVVTNVGTVTTTAVAVTDPLIKDVTCPVTTLIAGQQMTCSGAYVITQADVDAGGVNNTATATGTPPAGLTDPLLPGRDSTSTSIAPHAALHLEKRARVVHGRTPVSVGQSIAYTFDVVNVGNVTVADIAIHDRMLQPTCPVSVLAPGQRMTCTGTHRVTTEDVGAGSVKNSASASGLSGCPDPGPAGQSGQARPNGRVDPAACPHGVDVVSNVSTAIVPALPPTHLAVPKPDGPGGGTVSAGPFLPIKGPFLPNTGGPAGTVLLGALISLIGGLLLLGRRRPRRNLVNRRRVSRGLVMIAAVLAVAACGAAGSGTDTGRGSGGTVSPQHLPTIPAVAHGAGAVADARFGHCGLSPGRQEVTGTVHNSTKAATDYLVAVSWTNATYDVLGRGIAVLRAVPAGEDRGFSVTASVPSGVTTCTYNVVRGLVR